MKTSIKLVLTVVVILASAWAAFFLYVGHLSAKPVIHDVIAKQLLDKFYADEMPPNAEGEIIIGEPLEGINIAGPWQVNITPSPDGKTRVRYFAYGKADIAHLFIGAGNTGDYKNLLQLRCAPPPADMVVSRLRTPNGDMRFGGDYYRAEVQLPVLKEIRIWFFEESAPHFSKIVRFSEFSQKALSLNIFAITDVLIHGENSSFENLYLNLSFSKGMEKGSAGFLRFGKVAVTNAEVDIIGPWRVNLNMSGGDLKGEIKYGAQLRYSGNATNIGVENAVSY